MENVNKKINLILEDVNDKNKEKIEYIETIKTARGVVVAKLQGKEDNYILKFIDLNNDEVYGIFDIDFRIKSIKNEILVLKDIKNEFDLLTFNGQTNNCLWLIMKSVEGVRSNDVFSSLTVNGISNDTSQRIESATKLILERINDLHEIKYLHRDIQPVHIIFQENDKVQLIDFGLAKKTDSANGINFEGGLVHYNSPEVAKEMLLENKDIKYDLLSEMYSIGSVLFFNYTGLTSTDYGTTDYKDVSFREKLEMIANEGPNQKVKNENILSDRNKELLEWMLQTNREKRCPNLAEALKFLN